MKSTAFLNLSALFFLAFPLSHCHDTVSCSPYPITAVDTAEYHSAFNAICGAANLNYYGYLTGCHASDRGQECCYHVEAKYEGTAGSKEHCWVRAPVFHAFYLLRWLMEMLTCCSVACFRQDPSRMRGEGGEDWWVLVDGGS